MNSEEKISIIIPVYNTEQFLKKCIDSVINQTYKNIEIICINDGSTDNSLGVLNSFNDGRINIISIKNHGVGYARNLGIEKSTGKYLIFLDSDDYIENTYCEELLNNLIKNSSDLSYCGHKTKTHNGKIKIEWNPFITSSIKPIDDRFKITRHLVVTRKLFKKSIIDEFNIKFDTELHYAEDSLFLIQYLIHCKLITGIKKMLYIINVNPKSLSRSPYFRLRRQREKLKAFGEIDKIIKNYKENL